MWPCLKSREETAGNLFQETTVRREMLANREVAVIQSVRNFLGEFEMCPLGNVSQWTVTLLG